MRLLPVVFIAILPGMVWSPAYADDNAPAAPGAAANAGPPAVIEADKLEGKQGDQVVASGKAVLRQDGQAIHADQLMYRDATRDVNATGSVLLEQDGNTMSGPQLDFNLDSGAGKMMQPQYHLEQNGGRGMADLLNIQDRQHYTLDNATYTTCPAGIDDWQVGMRSLEIDRDRQVGVARGATVEFKGVPFLYTPWMDFPLNDRNKTGFLAPVIGGTSKGGTELTLPFYWSLADNYDATIAPRYITKRGLMLNDEFRYLEPHFNGEVHADILPNDVVANRNREHFSLLHNQSLASNMIGYIDYKRVWDDAYYRDLGDAVNATSQVNLLQESGMRYYGDIWNIAVRAQQYQTLQDPAAPITPPYARLPQITAAGSGRFAGGTLAMAGEFVAFNHPDLLNARRVVLNPSYSFPLVSDAAYYVTPKIAFHSTYYSMGANNNSGLPNMSRNLSIFSLDSGFSLERDTEPQGGNYLQTFEPRIFYVYIPYRDQNSLPVFDTAMADFNFTQIFTENRYSGNDRIGDANQLTVAATSRLLDKDTGAERLKVMLGERFSFVTPQVNLGTAAASSGKSDVLLAAAGQVNRAFALDSEIQYDPNQGHTQRYNITARYHPEPGEALNFGYRFQREVLRQADISSQWPLSNRWRAVGRLNYSFPDSRILDAIAGLEYNRECWTLRLVAQHFTTATQQTNTGFFVQLELSGFVKVGADPLGTLKQSIPGYTPTSGQAAQSAPR